MKLITILDKHIDKLYNPVYYTLALLIGEGKWLYYFDTLYN